MLTHWGQVTHICISKLIIIGSDNGLLPGRCHAIIWTNVGVLLIGPLGTNFSEMLIEIEAFSFKKIHLKMSSGKWRPSSLNLNVLKQPIHQYPSHGREDNLTQHIYEQFHCNKSCMLIAQLNICFSMCFETMVAFTHGMLSVRLLHRLSSGGSRTVSGVWDVAADWLASFVCDWLVWILAEIASDIMDWGFKWLVGI